MLRSNKIHKEWPWDLAEQGSLVIYPNAISVEVEEWKPVEDVKMRTVSIVLEELR